MRARIHRGAREIGGNCVELEIAGKRLVLDLGRPLDAEPGHEVDLPEIRGLGAPDDGSLLGVVLSHPHQDHYGLVGQVAASVPIYVGRAAAAILDAAAFFAPSGIRLQPAGFLDDRRPFTLGPFTITPFLVDHSGFDSYALLVEGAGRRVFYSGDFRVHGRKGSLVRKLCERPPRPIDALLLEGTHVRDDDREDSGLDEHGVELAMATTFELTPGLVVVFSSTQNIDRLVTTYRACKRAKRTLVVDLYAATIAAAARDTIPQPGFPRLRVYVPNRQRILVKRSGEFERVDALRRHRIYLQEIAERAGELVMVIQGSTLAELAGAGWCLEGAGAIWSLWSGYLDQPSGARIRSLLEERGVPLTRLHASGHARVEDLQTLAAAMAPARIVPIHTSAPERFDALFSGVERHADGEWWEV